MRSFVGCAGTGEGNPATSRDPARGEERRGGERRRSGRRRQGAGERGGKEPPIVLHQQPVTTKEQGARGGGSLGIVCGRLAPALLSQEVTGGCGLSDR